VRLPGALAVLAAFSFGSASASAATPYDPAAASIDRVCNAYVPSAAKRDVVTLARLATHDGSVPRWNRSDGSTNERREAAPDFSGGDFATVVFQRRSIVVADTVHVDAPGGEVQTRTWCFIGGKLSRATSENVDPVAGFGWRRTLYYGDDLEKPLSESVNQFAVRQAPDPHARAPLDALGIDAVATPAKLPFFDVAVAAHGTMHRP
jgi:hypothetical protein